MHLNVIGTNLVVGADSILLLIEDQSIILLPVPKVRVLGAVQDWKALNGTTSWIYFINCIQSVLIV